MKRILFLLLIISTIARAQSDDSTKYINYRYKYGNRESRGQFDSVFKIPFVDTSLFHPARPGALLMRPADSLIYQWNGAFWGVLIGSGGGGGANNYPTSAAFSNNVLTINRNGLSALTPTWDSSKYHSVGFYDGRYQPPGSYEITSNKSTTTTLGTSNTLYPSQNAVKAYVDNAISGIGPTSLTQYRLAVGNASNQISSAAAITPSRALVSDANGVPTHSTTTTTELGYVAGVTSAIQTQINSKLTATSVNSDLQISSSQLKWANWVNVLDAPFNADSTGATSNNTAFQKAIDTANKYGKRVYIPHGKYWLDGASSGAYQILGRSKMILLGDGINSKVFITSNTRLLSLMDADSVEISGINFIGNNSGTWQTGIFFYANTATSTAFNIHNCWFQNFGGDPNSNGGGAIYGDIAAANSLGGRIHDNFFIGNNAALNLKSRGEYVAVTNNTFSANTQAIAIGAGNLDIVGNIIEGNTNGIYRYAGANNGHSNISNNVINHSTGWALDWNDVDFLVGDILSSNDVYFGHIRFVNCFNVRISNNNWGSMDSIIFDNSRYNIAVNLSIGKNPFNNPVPLVFRNGAEDFTYIAKARNDTLTATNFIQQQHPDTILFKGPIYHTGITPASTSSLDSVWVKDATTGQGKLRAQSAIGAGSGGTSSGFRRLKFTVDSTSYAPVAGDSVLTYSAYVNKFLKVFREGEHQYDSTTYSGVQIDPSLGKITFHPPLSTGERVIIEAYDTTGIRFDGFTAPPSGYQTESDTYFAAVATAGGTLTTGQKNAYDAWVVSEKSAGRYSKYTAIYPFLGGTAASHAINAKTPGTYNLTFNGTWTHDAQGSKATVADSYAQTGINNTDMTQDNNFFSVYTNQTGGDGYMFGAYSGNAAFRLAHISSTMYTSAGNNAANTTTVSSAVGYHIVTRVASGQYYYVNNAGSNTITQTSDAPVAPNVELYLSDINNVTATGSTNRLCFVTIGKTTGLTSAEATAAVTTMSTLISALGR